jgi:hypothetical protein
MILHKIFSLLLIVFCQQAEQNFQTLIGTLTHQLEVYRKSEYNKKHGIEDDDEESKAVLSKKKAEEEAEAARKKKVIFFIKTVVQFEIHVYAIY